MIRKLFFSSILIFLFTGKLFASYILIPMDNMQKNHLKAYGIAYWIIQKEVNVQWLLNYRSGSFMFKYDKSFEDECIIRGVTTEIIADAKSTSILTEIANPEVNMDVVLLEKPPKVAVYSPKTKKPWDDAVTLVLTYSEIPYDVVYDEEVIQDKLVKY